MGFSFFRKIYNNDEKQKNNKKLQPSIIVIDTV